MKITLRAFQEEAVERLERLVARARREWVEDQVAQAVGLAAPTGSGKTAIATALIERVLFGGPDTAPQPDAMFLWMTDQPELNLQTRNKMLSTSSVLTADRFVVIENTFDAPALWPGLVYFLNTQKLGERAALVQPPSDLRLTTFWDTVNATIEDPARTLYVVVDEAHRGMVEDRREREAANSIIQRFIKGSNEMRPAPVILGISATPARYDAVVAGAGRTSRPYAVSPEVVRESGLLKERIVVSHAGESQTGDMTLLRAAARAWKEIDVAWSEYCAVQREPVAVIPALVIQVEDERGAGVSATDIAGCIRAIREEAGPLVDVALVHAFQDHGDMTFGDTTVRYVAPSDIAEDTDARVIFFKKSLNQGWDCPRAEVMFSFRRASDYTNIAQLVGRMVRAPLTRHITENEQLNAVSLYLPYYDRRQLQRVIDHLTSAGEAAAAVEVVVAEKVINLRRAAGSDAVFAALEAIPTYIVPRTRKTSDVRRLDALARALSIDEIDLTAARRERATLVAVLLEARDRLADDPDFQALVAERGTLTIRRVEWAYGERTTGDEEMLNIPVSEENITALFAAAGRSLGGEVHQGYWEARAEAELAARDSARLELVALALGDEVRSELEGAAIGRIRALFDAHGTAIDQLPAGRRAVYSAVIGQSGHPERVPLHLPDVADFTVGDEAWNRHVYASDDGTAPLALNTWETDAIAPLIGREETVGWLRIEPRKEWALCIPYQVNGQYRPLYPDLLVVRQEGPRLRVDLIDPHNPDLADADDKAKGLAIFARDHGHLFGRMELTAKVIGQMRRLDLKDERTRSRILAVDSPAALKALFIST